MALQKTIEIVAPLHFFMLAVDAERHLITYIVVTFAVFQLRHFIALAIIDDLHNLIKKCYELRSIQEK